MAKLNVRSVPVYTLELTAPEAYLLNELMDTCELSRSHLPEDVQAALTSLQEEFDRILSSTHPLHYTERGEIFEAVKYRRS